jgi:hypothetical protein
MMGWRQLGHAAVIPPAPSSALIVALQCGQEKLMGMG